MPTTSPRFDGTISLGNVLVILTLIVSAVLAWAANRERSLSNAAAIERLSGDMDEIEARLRAVEIALGSDRHGPQ